MHLRVDGVDCIGKNILRLRPKIYFADHGFREAFFSGSNNRNIEQVLENIVATELTRRGWSLRFGSVSDKKATSSLTKTAGECTSRSAIYLRPIKPWNANFLRFRLSETTGQNSYFLLTKSIDQR